MRDTIHQRTNRQRHETKETSYEYFIHNILKDDGRKEESERVASTSHLTDRNLFASCVSDLFSLSFFLLAL
jgi:hypothetical protein